MIYFRFFEEANKSLRPQVIIIKFQKYEFKIKTLDIGWKKNQEHDSSERTEKQIANTEDIILHSSDTQYKEIILTFLIRQRNYRNIKAQGTIKVDKTKVKKESTAKENSNVTIRISTRLNTFEKTIYKLEYRAE